jgi:AraC-like DNA-binding protein
VIHIKTYKSKFFKSKNLPYLEARLVKDSEYHYHKHFHKTLSIGAIEEGQVFFLYQKETTILKPNELVIINPNIIHSCNPIKNEARTYHMIYLDSTWCQNIQETIFGKLEMYIPVSKLKIQNKNIFNEFIDLNYALLNNNIFYLEKEELLQNFLIKIFKQYCVKPLSQDILLTNNNINLAKQYIEDNINSNITVNEISTYLNISEFYFFKIFKQAYNISPHAFLLNQKICRAKQLLIKGNNISDIAYELGFSDQSHFNKVFKYYVAATPYEYKNSILKK